MSNDDSALLDACLAGNQPEALALARRGVGLRHFCARRDLEPLAACARMGYGDVLELIIAGSFFDERESALREAMGEAVAHGHLRLALRCGELGGSIDFASLEQALDHGHSDTVRELMRLGHIESKSNHPDIPSALDNLFLCCCWRALDVEARQCMALGARLEGKHADECAHAIASRGLDGVASAWLDASPKLSRPTERAWNDAFAALMLSRREKIELERPESAVSQARKSRL